MKPSAIERVIIKNYKSIAKCDVRLGPLQFLVGRNGAGKSNFLDALAFVRDAVARNGLEHTADAGCGIEQVHRSNGRMPTEFGMRLEFKFDAGLTGTFAFEVDTGKNQVRREQCYIKKNNSIVHYYRVDSNNVDFSKNPLEIALLKDARMEVKKENFPPVSPDRFYLHNMAALDGYRQVYHALWGIGIYNFNPRVMAPLSPARKDFPVFTATGSNIANVFDNLSEGAKERIQEYLRAIVPVIHEVKSVDISGEFKRLEFVLETGQQKSPLSLPAINMSDGTLRAVGILTALLQRREYREDADIMPTREDADVIPTFVGIEEPETALHASASGVLVGALQEASETRQVIVTTHSPDVLDEPDISPEMILPVEMKGTETLIGPMEDVSRDAIKKHLMTAGELLRQDQIHSDEIFPSSSDEMSLFPEE